MEYHTHYKALYKCSVYLLSFLTLLTFHLGNYTLYRHIYYGTRSGSGFVWSISRELFQWLWVIQNQNHPCRDPFHSNAIFLLCQTSTSQSLLVDLHSRCFCTIIHYFFSNFCNVFIMHINNANNTVCNMTLALILFSQLSITILLHFPPPLSFTPAYSVNPYNEFTFHGQNRQIHTHTHFKRQSFYNYSRMGWVSKSRTPGITGRTWNRFTAQRMPFQTPIQQCQI